jgi:DNA-directed RNA polymerase alpha subunit
MTRHRIHITEELLRTPVADLSLPVRTINQLIDHNIITVMDLLYCCGKVVECLKCDKLGDCPAKIRLLDIPQFGKASLDKIYQALEFESLNQHNRCDRDG